MNPRNFLGMNGCCRRGRDEMFIPYIMYGGLRFTRMATRVSHYHYIDGSIIHYFCHVFFSSIFCFISLYRTAKRRREVMMLRR